MRATASTSPFFASPWRIDASFSANFCRRAVALVVAVALAGSPAMAQTPAASEQSVSAAKAPPQFGAINPPAPVPSLPLAMPSQPLPDLGDAAQADLSPAQERK